MRGGARGAESRRRTAALADYVDYYNGLAQLRLKQLPEAKRTFERCSTASPRERLRRMAALAQGETAEAAGDYARRRRDLPAAREPRSTRSTMTCCRGSAARRWRPATARQRPQAYLRVYYEFALTDAATAAASQLRDAAGSDRQDRLPAGSRPRGDAVRRAALRRGAQPRSRRSRSWRAATIASSPICASPSATSI